MPQAAPGQLEQQWRLTCLQQLGTCQLQLLPICGPLWQCLPVRPARSPLQLQLRLRLKQLRGEEEGIAARCIPCFILHTARRSHALQAP